MGRVPSILVAASLIFVSAAPAQLQLPRAAFNPDLVCHQLVVGQLTRVQYDLPRAGGTLGPDLTCDQRGITLDAYAGEPGPQTIEAAAIRQLWVRRGSGLAGAIWGGIAGGLLGYAIASARTHICPIPPNSTIQGCHANIPVGIGLGMVSGAGIGWFFGRGIPRWSLVYRAHP